MELTKRLLCRLVAIGIYALCANSAVAQQEASSDVRGREIVQEACSICHELRLIYESKKSLSEWEETIGDMMGRGAPIMEGEREIVLQFLAKNSGPDSPKTNVNEATTQQLVTAFGLTQKEAADIVRYKQENGTIRGWEDLRKIPGLDVKKLETKKEILSFM